jgi:hypothetical protein
MITRFAVFPDERNLLMGVDNAKIFEPGFVYEVTTILDEIRIKKVGKYALPEKGNPSELSDIHTIAFASLHLYTKEEIEQLNK